MKEKIEEYLRELLETEPTDATSLMILSLNSAQKLELGLPILIKYINNILSSPNEPKYRRIKTSNKIFLVCLFLQNKNRLLHVELQEKVAPLKGSLEFLKALGFIEDDQRNADGGIDTFLALPELDEETTTGLENAAITLDGDNPVQLKLYREPKVRFL